MSVEENNEVENDVTASGETGNEEVKNDQSISSVETNNVEESATNEVVTYNAASTNEDTAVNNQNTNTTETNSVDNTTPVEEVQVVENVEETQAVENVESNVQEAQPTENVETNTVQKKEVTPSTPNYDTAKDQVNNYNQSVNDKFQDKLNGYENAPGLTIVEGDKVTINTNISGVNDSIAEEEKENNQQLANIDEILAQYKDAMDKYKDDLAKYEEARNAYIEHLKELGLWKEGDEDPLKLSQLLVLGNEENAVAKVEALKNGVTQGSGSLLDGKLNIFYKVSGNQTGDFLRVTYTNIQNSTYAGKTISKIVITYSDWTRKNLNDGRTSGIYFSKNPLDGFFYVGASGVTMDLKLYDADNNLITLAENTAYITVGSLNSTGNGTNYIEKAEIINTGGYRGSGVQLPESSVTVHKGQGEHGGDIVYSEKNNEIISKYNLSDKDKNTAIGIWGEAAVNKYTGWDEVDRKKEIFGSGLFKVNGIGVKIRFSNALGSAWSTFSTNIPKITFEAAIPEMPNYLIPWHKTEVNLNAQTSVHIHYVDVHEEAKKGTTDFKPEHGTELIDQKQSHHDLAINDQYSNTLWNWESANYILATDSVHPDAIQGITTENEKHVYVYLKHNSVEDTRSKVVNQVIHYVYENGSQAAPDYNGVTLVFTQTGTRDTVTGEVVWDGEWTQSQRFESVASPTIKGYHTNRPVVEAYDIVVDNSNFDQNLDKEDTVVYVANPTEEVSRDKVVNQVIHYVYESGSQAAPDYKGVPLVFTQTGTRDTVTGEVVWDGEWTQSQRFESVASPTIKGYHTNRPVVEAYDIVVDNSNFDQNLDKEDTVVYVANPTEEVSRDKVVNQVIHYVYESGSQAAPDYKGVPLVFTQTGTRDTVTGEVVWDGEWTQSQRFESVASPTIKGYHTNRPVVEAYDIVVDNSNFDQNLDKEDTVVYVANPTEEVSRDKVVNQVIHYVYENGSQAAPDHTSVALVFTQTGTKDTVTGEVVWDGEWTQSQRFESVASPTIKGYHTDRPVVEAYDIVVDNSNFDQNLDKEDTVVYVANPTEEVSRDKVVNQVIHYVYENGSQAAPDHTSVALVFTQTGTKDTVTGEVVWDGEWTQSQRFESVASPTIKGYHTDRPVVDAYDIVVDNSNFDQNLDKEDTVVYVANPTEEVNRDKVVNQVIHYVYENGSQAAPDYKGVPLVFTQTGTKDKVTGEVVWDGEWTQSQRFESVASPTIKGYHTDRPVVEAYDIVVDNSNFDQNLDKEDTVVYVANPTEEVSRDKVVNQVIHYVYENGSQAAPDHTSVALVFTQTGTKDTVTGEVVWDGEWTQSQRFESVASPTIKGYHTDRPVVDAYDIVVDNSNFDQNLDKEDIVVYVADPVDPEEPKDPVDPEEPKDPVDPEEPKDPVDPEEPKDPVDPEEPKDPVDPEEPKDPVDPEEPEEPKDPEDPEDSKVPVQAETPTESTNDAPILPDQLSTNTTIKEVATVETKESGKAEAATTEDVSLPQTGHKHSNAGIIGLGLATIASLLGLAGTRKRKKD